MKTFLSKNIANLLTVTRLVMVLPILLLLYLPGERRFLYALLLFGVAMPTDALDGYLARKLHQTSEFGKFFDPLSDKIVIMVMLFSLFYFRVYQPYVIFPMFLRDSLVDGLRNYAAKTGRVLPANFSGKTKFTLQTLSIVAGLWHLHLHVPAASPFLILANLLLAGAFLVSLWGLPILYSAHTEHK